MNRRTALARVIALPLVGAFPLAFGGCSRSLQCSDLSGLSPEDVKLRSETAGYVELSPDVTKRCDACLQFTAGAPDACGSCKLVKGPINPVGTCKLFAPKKA